MSNLLDRQIRNKNDTPTFQFENSPKAAHDFPGNKKNASGPWIFEAEIKTSINFIDPFRHVLVPNSDPSGSVHLKCFMIAFNSSTDKL